MVRQTSGFFIGQESCASWANCMRPPIEVGDHVVITHGQHPHRERTAIVNIVFGPLTNIQLVDDTEHPFVPLGDPFDIHTGSILRIPTQTEQNARKTHVRAVHFKNKRKSKTVVHDPSPPSIRTFKQFTPRGKIREN